MYVLFDIEQVNYDCFLFYEVSWPFLYQIPGHFEADKIIQITAHRFIAKQVK